ncbi:CPBP family intramembrane glutamic endopeptidase [Pseudoclavibacter sp. Z016]|uniref:CPBP family intramembrane glutamic endopeptidase n=1 Tax=Pseudoclavibacter sp. Z016 TaxID=2080581 RepID=UPI0015E31F7A|nr:CPBP family intramembrane glutamic endopeptidase [Pseudoclavibacter sp. Z016]
MTATTLVTGSRKPGILTALAAVVVYVALAAGLGNLLSSLVSDDQEVAQFALGHLIPLPIGIALLLLYVRWTGNAEQVWRERPTPTLTPRRWYLVSIPILMIASSLAVLAEVAWAEQTFALIAVITLGTLLVGFGEELAVRGVLLTAVRQRHGELAVLLITSLVFALAHIPGSIIAGAPPAVIAFQLGGLIIAGASYYWIRRVTGRLWVGALIHAFSDWNLYLAADAGTQAASVPNSHEAPADPFIGTLGVVLWIILAVGVVSVIREDRRNRRQDASSL